VREISSCSPSVKWDSIRGEGKISVWRLKGARAEEGDRRRDEGAAQSRLWRVLPPNLPGMRLSDASATGKGGALMVENLALPHGGALSAIGPARPFERAAVPHRGPFFLRYLSP
jgi:hypothetical protein